MPVRGLASVALAAVFLSLTALGFATASPEEIEAQPDENGAVSSLNYSYPVEVYDVVPDPEIIRNGGGRILKLFIITFPTGIRKGYGMDPFTGSRSRSMI